LIKLLRHPFGTVNSRESHYQVWKRCNSIILRIEHYYFVDIAGMALWSDGKIENNEVYISLADIISVPDAL
jgi:hypothetical protein